MHAIAVAALATLDGVLHYLCENGHTGHKVAAALYFSYFSAI